jgi:hypothetical protein
MVGGHHPDVVAFDIGGEQRVKCRACRRRQKEVAWQVLVVWIRFDDRVTVDGAKDVVSRDVPSGQPHVHMIRPVHLAFAETALNELKRVIRTAPAR